MNPAASHGADGHTGSDNESQLSRPAAPPAASDQDLQMKAFSPPRNFGLGTKRSRSPPRILTPRIYGQDYNQDWQPSRRPRTADQSEDTGPAKGVAGALHSLRKGAGHEAAITRYETALTGYEAALNSAQYKATFTRYETALTRYEAALASLEQVKQ